MPNTKAHITVEAPRKPPKKWWDKHYKEVKEGNPSYSDKQVRETVGDIWYHKMSPSKKRKEVKKEKGSLRVVAFDPDAALDGLRESLEEFEGYIYNYETLKEGGAIDDAIDSAHEAKNYFDGLNEWLSMGGFLPAKWDASRKQGKLRVHSAFSHSFSPEFYGDVYEPRMASKPTNVADALASMDENTWDKMAQDVFGVSGEMLGIATVMQKIIETDTVGTLTPPVDVWIDPEGFWTVDVYDEPREGNARLEAVKIRQAAITRRVDAQYSGFVFPNLFSSEAKRWIETEVKRRAALRARNSASPEQTLAFIDQAAQEVAAELAQAVTAEVATIVSDESRQKIFEEINVPEEMVEPQISPPAGPPAGGPLERPMEAPLGASTKLAQHVIDTDAAKALLFNDDQLYYHILELRGMADDARELGEWIRDLFETHPSLPKNADIDWYSLGEQIKL